MNTWRTEIRIFGLIIVAVLCSVVLGFGIRAAGASGEIGGVKFFIAGPSSAFIILLLLFWMMGLFKIGLAEARNELDRPVENMSLDDIERALDKLEIDKRELNRTIASFEKAKDAAKSGATIQEVLMASGMRPATRAG